MVELHRKLQESFRTVDSLCYATVVPSHKSAIRAGFWPDCYRERTEIGPPACTRPAGEQISLFFQ